MADSFSAHQAALDSPADRAAEVTPDNSNDLASVARALYVGGAGNVKITTRKGSTVTLVAVPAGTILPCTARRVFATGTTATSIVALW